MRTFAYSPASYTSNSRNTTIQGINTAEVLQSRKFCTII